MVHAILFGGRCTAIGWAIDSKEVWLWHSAAVSALALVWYLHSAAISALALVCWLWLVLAPLVSVWTV